jgi:O-antigen/teichoic acid export membrane protein
VKKPWREVLASILTLFWGTALAQLLLTVTLVVMARTLGPEAYGQYSATLALVGLVGGSFSLGLDGWLLYYGGREPELLIKGFGSAFVIKLLVGAVWIPGLLIVSPVLNQSSFPGTLVAVGAVAVWLEELTRLIWSSFKARLHSDLVLVSMALSQGALLLLTLWLVHQHAQEPQSYMTVRLLAACWGTAMAGLIALRKLGLRPRAGNLRATLLDTVPFGVSFMCATIYGRADLSILANQLGQGAAGIYAPALNVVSFLFILPTSVYGVMVPLLSRMHVRGQISVRPTSAWLVSIMAVTGLGLGVGLGLTSDIFIQIIYGASFEPSGQILAILGGVLALRCPSMALAAVLVAAGWQTRRMKVQVVAAVFNVVVNLLIVQSLGVVGVAGVYVMTEAVLFLGYLLLFLQWARREKRV